MNSAPKKRRPLRALVRLILLCVALELAFIGVVFLVGQSTYGVEPKASDAIVVLGAKVWPSGAPTRVLYYRLMRAKQLLDDGMGQYIVVCGAQGRDEHQPEADSMAAFLVEKGVPEVRILRDPDGLDTVQSLVNAKSIMESRGLETCIVVTSDYHLTRALWNARDVGLDACGAPAPYPDGIRKLAENYFRETVSWANHFTGGFLEKLVRGG